MVEHNIHLGMVSHYEKELLFSRSPVSQDLEYLLATPQIIEVIIEAASRMLDPLLPDPYITIGTKIDFTHEKPTLVMDGRPVRTELRVEEIKGTKILLDVKCFDGIGQIGFGKYERAIVDKERLRFATYRRADQAIL